MSTPNPADPNQPAWGQPGYQNPSQPPPVYPPSVYPPPAAHPYPQPIPGQPMPQQPMPQQPVSPQPAVPGYPQTGYPQPAYQQPGYQQPSYQQPGYDQAYQQPVYQQAGYDPSAYVAGYPPAAPPRKPKTWLWVTLGIAAVVLIGCGVGYLKVIKPMIDEGNATLATPQTVAGLTLSSDPSLVNLANSMKTELRSEVKDATGSIGAFYTDPSGDQSTLVMVVGVTGRVSDPRSELDDAFDGLATGGFSASDPHDVDPGRLGGEARCASAIASGQALIACAWADHGSVAMILFFNRDAAESEQLFREMRDAIETRG